MVGADLRRARLDLAAACRSNPPMQAVDRQSVAIIGTGAVGCYYGARLAEAGHDVRFLMQRGYDAVRANGLRVASHLGDIHLPTPTLARSAEELAALGAPDWLLVALKSCDLDQLAPLAGPLTNGETRILAIVDGIGIEDDIVDILRRYRVFGGLGFIGVGLPTPGNVLHREFGALEIGHRDDDGEALEEALALWEPTVVGVRPAGCLVRARWVKMLWDVPFNGLSVVAGGANAETILETPALGAFARNLMAEIARIANADLAARGMPPIEDPDAACERAMRLMGTTERHIPPAGVDFVRRRPLEAEAMFERPAARAAELGVDAPLTAFMAALIHRLNPVSMI